MSVGVIKALLPELRLILSDANVQENASEGSATLTPNFMKSAPSLFSARKTTSNSPVSEVGNARVASVDTSCPSMLHEYVTGSDDVVSGASISSESSRTVNPHAASGKEMRGGVCPSTFTCTSALSSPAPLSTVSRK